MPCEQHKDCPECARHDAEIRKQERERAYQYCADYTRRLYHAGGGLSQAATDFSALALSDRSEQQTDAPSR